MADKMEREEAIQYLTMQGDLATEAARTNDLVDYLRILRETGDKIGYTPAFRCLVKGLEPEEAIRWGK